MTVPWNINTEIYISQTTKTILGVELLQKT